MSKKIIYINLDGFSYSYYEEFHRRKMDKNFNFLKNNNMFFKNLENGIISITNPMQSAILCGAWSNKTHNIYQHYDRVNKCVVKDKRTFDAENIAQTMEKNHKTVVSIHQFMLENNPCSNQNHNCCYLKSDKEQSNYLDRFQILFDVINSKPINTGKIEVNYTTLPDLICLYIDDLDALGHNNSYDNFPARCSHYQRLEDILVRINQIFVQIDKLIDLLKEKKIYDDVVILVTTDHGMTPFYGKSQIQNLQESITKLGYTVSTSPGDDADVFLLPYTISCGLYALKKVNISKIIKKLKSEGYIDVIYDKKTMITKYGLTDIGPDIMVYAKKGYHFYHRDFISGIYGASHDSRDESSKHIFGIIVDSSLSKKVNYEKVYSIDLLPSVLDYAQGLHMKDSEGKIYKNWFI